MRTPEQNHQRNEEIIRRRKSGEAPSDIARSMCLTKNVVLGALYRAGLTAKDSIKSRSAAASPEFRACVLAALTTGTYNSVSAEWGVSKNTISCWLRGL